MSPGVQTAYSGADLPFTQSKSHRARNEIHGFHATLRASLHHVRPAPIPLWGRPLHNDSQFPHIKGTPPADNTKAGVWRVYASPYGSWCVCFGMALMDGAAGVARWFCCSLVIPDRLCGLLVPCYVPFLQTSRCLMRCALL